MAGRKEREREGEISLYNATRLKEWNRGWMNVMAERGIRLSGQRSGRKVPYKSKSGGSSFQVVSSFWKRDDRRKEASIRTATERRGERRRRR